ncbi:uncharacterized protein LOC114914948 [Cajanus cajan]|uniref:uncharacterized protein LOC114914948 n=1 Tax=Cajanus cajan TaxID=3821 RepID=UPI0010FAD089|nr:uncharacterized protein LOC114914948 [Cajanus cajan]
MIEEAILDADKKGIKVLSLGLMNQGEELNIYGGLYVSRHPKLKVKVVDGSSLVVAIVLNNILKGTTQVLLRGKLTKVTNAFAYTLCQQGVKVSTMHKDDYERPQNSSINFETNLIIAKSYTQMTMYRANEQIARAMEMMVMAMQQQNAYFARAEADRTAAGATRPTGSQESQDLAEFRKCHPPQFKGDADPEVADHWICELEKIFTVLGCSQERRLAYDVYMLVGEAEHWWRSTHHMLTARGAVVDWECFKRVFLEKYFPESVRHAKEAEFMRLHQGGMTVSEYAMKFEHLAHFYSQGIAEAWKCRKFTEGLKYDLKRVVVPMAITEFPALVEKAKVVERLEGGNREVKTTEGPSGSKKGGNQRKPYDRPQPQQGGPVSRQSSGAAGGGRQGGSATLRCYRCAGPHMVRDCLHTESHYFRCHQMGHESANCPTRGRPEGGDARRGGAQRDLVKGKGRAAGKDVTILFDSGASHSFISYACAAMLGVPVCDLGSRLLVLTPASASVVASELCAGMD